MHRRWLFILALCSAPLGAAEIKVGAPLPRIAMVKEGTHHWLRYVRNGEVNTPVDIWTREVRQAPDGMQIRQRWDGVNNSVVLLDSWFDKDTFKPRTHQRIREKEGKRTVEDYDFAAYEPTFNFETDIEFLQALPLAAGYEASIMFYHPGGPAPARFTWKVVGSETIQGPQGAVDCWLLTTDYNRPGTVAKFWLAKATQLLVRQEATAPDGRIMVKSLID
ncbi:hypothetical protein ACN9MZ_19395 [Pseudoduganella sp. S-14]|jgi:hypothetical protein|uniref:DUF3108 domain-containing protein n=1 Tax=Pseudoduganella sp. S-14 TaxID=3404065 RepID=UPI003CFA8704